MAEDPAPAPADPPPPETVHDYFIAQLRRLRAERGLSQTQLAAAIHFSAGLVSMVETGQRPPTTAFAAAVDETLETGGILTGLLPILMRESYPTWFRSYVALEAESAAMYMFEAQLIPGLFQTADYARTIMSTYWPPRSRAETESLVEARLERQKILDRDGPPLITAIVDESALHRPVGGAAIMGRQLRHLIEAARRPAVRLHVLTYEQSARSHLDGAFTVLELTNKERLAYIQGLGVGQILPRPEAVDVYATRFESILGESLSPTASMSYINEIVEDRYENAQRSSASLVEEQP